MISSSGVFGAANLHSLLSKISYEREYRNLLHHLHQTETGLNWSITGTKTNG